MRRIAIPLRMGLLTLAATVGTDASAQMAESADQEAVTIEIEGERPAPPVRADVAKTAALIVEKSNAFRQEQGLAPVAVDQQLSQTAQDFADYMAKHDRYGHQADGRVPSERVKAHGYAFAIVAENVAYSFDSRGYEADPLAARFTQGWIESPHHRQNLVDPDVVQTGVGVAESEKTHNYYAVQLFGRPASMNVSFTILNTTDAPIAYAAGGRDFALEPRFARTHQFGRPPELTFRWPEASGQQPTTLRPASGESFRVEQDDAGKFAAVRVTEPEATPATAPADSPK